MNAGELPHFGVLTGCRCRPLLIESAEEVQQASGKPRPHSTIALLLPALARLVRMIDAPFLPVGVLGGLLVLNFYVAALVAFDLGRLGKVHPITIWGALIFLIAWPGRVWLGYTEAWQNIAGTLIG